MFNWRKCTFLQIIEADLSQTIFPMRKSAYELIFICKDENYKSGLDCHCDQNLCQNLTRKE
jgi:hypothetical protein